MSALEDYLFEIDQRENETVLEVIDRSKARVLTSKRIEGTVEMLNARTAYRYGRDQDGSTVIEVFSVRVSKP